MNDQNDPEDDVEDEVALDATEETESFFSSIMFPLCVLAGLSILGILVGIAMM
ncbi:hypothetical protein GMO_27930 [Gluconobacter morbifer G707]|uniref:Uncharacterized protein n=2 Tax=Gluconobacter TaxID=441 RepID=G6XMS5_9PROT|nr:hypothetical protein GMO_27930 [Gluconobacter morbifer G707]